MPRKPTASPTSRLIDMSDTFRLAPLGRIGILGGGQLGRMLALAAARLGYESVIFCPEDNCPAALVTRQHIKAEYSDAAALTAFAGAVDLVTFEFENIPTDTLAFLAKQVEIAPGIEALRVSQDRLLEKEFLTRNGIDVAPYAPFDDADSLATAFGEIGRPAIAKTRRFGYDGKGQITLRAKRDFDEVLSTMGDTPGILERVIDFDREISVVVARNRDGDVAAFPIGENVHKGGILVTTTVPAEISDTLEAKAKVIAARIANALDYVGVLAVELFVATGGHLLVNEIAPRVHNTGHWTIEGAKTSQFEQHIRAICGLPLGPVAAIGWAQMENLIGDAILDHQKWISEDGAYYHHYGKTDPRPGRKMGHVTRVVRD